MDIAITIPKSDDWEEWLLECKKVEQSNEELRFRVGVLPKKAVKGDKCFVVHDSYIRGYHVISDVGYRNTFICSTTGQKWEAGNYIIRKGKFHEIEPVPKQGFQGFRYVDINI
jgi:hypothetical protein